MRTLKLPIVASVLLLLASVASAAGATNDEHMHTRILNHPVDGKPIPAAPYTFRIVNQVHDMPGTATSIRVADGSNVKKTVSISIVGPTAVAPELAFTVDFSSWAVGRHELRWTLNRPQKTDSSGRVLWPRLYNSSGWEICIVSCTPNLTSGRGSFPDSPFIEARGWQVDYANVRILTAVKNLRAGSKFKVQAANTATTGECYSNPDIHNGSRGVPVGRFSRTVTELTIPSGTTKLVCQANQGTRAGVLAIVLPATSDPATVDIETQVWWNSTGLVVR
jgi:hypothetical protein